MIVVGGCVTAVVPGAVVIAVVGGSVTAVVPGTVVLEVVGGCVSLSRHSVSGSSAQTQ